MSGRQQLTLISGGLACEMPGASADPARHILWTGGWDSSFRVLSLLATDSALVVQPHYIVNPARLSQALEIDAMARIRQRAAERWGPRLLEPRLIPLEEITVSDESRAAYRQLTQHYHIGPQYLWLSAYAHSLGTAVELCIHADDRATGVAAALQQRTTDAAATMPIGGLFGEHFTFPLLPLTKLQMSAEAERLGFRDLMDLTWFCQIPSRRGTPCGFCNPCRWTIAEGLGRRIPPGRHLRLTIYRHLVRRLPGFRVREALRRRLMR